MGVCLWGSRLLALGLGVHLRAAGSSQGEKGGLQGAGEGRGLEMAAGSPKKPFGSESRQGGVAWKGWGCNYSNNTIGDDTAAGTPGGAHPALAPGPGTLPSRQFSESEELGPLETMPCHSRGSVHTRVWLVASGGTASGQGHSRCKGREAVLIWLWVGVVNPEGSAEEGGGGPGACSPLPSEEAEPVAGGHRGGSGRAGPSATLAPRRSQKEGGRALGADDPVWLVS